MTFQDIQNDVIDRLGVEYDGKILARTGRFINQRYREVVSGVGLQTAVRTLAMANTVVGNRSVTFPCEKLFAVFDPSVTPPRVLGERSFDELRNLTIGTDPPLQYAIQVMQATSVTIWLDCTPASVYPLQADAEVNVLDLTGTQEPNFAADYHDILVHGALADEWESTDKGRLHEQKFEKRLAELRYFIAKSAYGKLYQHKTQVRATTPLV